MRRHLIAWLVCVAALPMAVAGEAAGTLGVFESETDVGSVKPDPQR